jgi:hypothetical protein
MLLMALYSIQKDLTAAVSNITIPILGLFSLQMVGPCMWGALVDGTTAAILVQLRFTDTQRELEK